MLTKICTEWDILWLKNKLLSALWGRSHVIAAMFLNYLNHIFGVRVLQFFVTYPLGKKTDTWLIISPMPMYWSDSLIKCNFPFSASLYVFGDTSLSVILACLRQSEIQRAIMSCQKLIERNGSLHQLLL